MPDPEIDIPPFLRKKVNKADIPPFLQKKNGISNGLTNGEDVATTSVPSTSPLPVNGNPFSFDKFIPQKLDNAQEVPILPQQTEQDKRLTAKYPIVKTYNGTVVRFKNENEAAFYEKNNGIEPTTPTTEVPKDAHPFNFDKFIPDQLSIIPLAGSLEDANKEDSKRANYVWNKFVKGATGEMTFSGDIMYNLMAKTLPKSILGDTPENVVKSYRGEIAPVIQSEMKRRFDAPITSEQEAKYDNEFLTSAVGGLAEFAPALLGSKGMRPAAIFFQVANGGLETVNSTKKGKELPEDTKTIFSWGVGIAGTAAEVAGIEKIFGKQTTKVATNLAVKTLTDLVKKSDVPITAEVFENALGVAAKTLKRQIIDAGGKIGKAGVVEFATGSIQESTNLLAEEILNQAEGKQIFDKSSWVDKIGRVLYSGAQEAVGGGILGTASIPFSTTRNYIAEKVAASKTPEDLAALKSEVMVLAENKKLSETEIQQLSETIDNYIRVNQKIPPDTESRKEIAEKIIEREDIENEVTKKLEEVVSVDEAFKPAIREESEALRGRVEEINEEIKNLASPIDTKLSEPIEGVDEQGIPIGENVPKPTDTSLIENYRNQKGVTKEQISDDELLKNIAEQAQNVSGGEVNKTGNSADALRLTIEQTGSKELVDAATTAHPLESLIKKEQGTVPLKLNDLLKVDLGDNKYTFVDITDPLTGKQMKNPKNENELPTARRVRDKMKKRHEVLESLIDCLTKI